MSNTGIEYRISLSNIEYRMSQCFRLDGDIFENVPRVDADLFIRIKKMHFNKIRIRVDEAFANGMTDVAHIQENINKDYHCF